MPDLSDWRASMAVMRYHLLTGLRAAGAGFWTTFIITILPLVRAPLGVPESHLASWEPAGLLYESAQTVTAVCVLHLGLIVLATMVITAPRRPAAGRLNADLMDTAPILPMGRFAGDMLGAMACAVVVHLCVLPFIAFAFVMSPVPSSLFWWYELIVLALIVLSSAGTAWKRQLHGAGGRARATGQVAGTILLAFLFTASTTRWPYFREAFADFLGEPSPRRWSAVTAEVMNPPLLVLLLALLYFGSIVYFAIQSHRLLRRNQEGQA